MKDLFFIREFVGGGGQSGGEEISDCIRQIMTAEKAKESEREREEKKRGEGGGREGERE